MGFRLDLTETRFAFHMSSALLMGRPARVPSRMPWDAGWTNPSITLDLYGSSMIRATYKLSPASIITYKTKARMWEVYE